MTGSVRYLLDTNIVSELARHPQAAIAQRIAGVRTRASPRDRKLADADLT